MTKVNTGAATAISLHALRMTRTRRPFRRLLLSLACSLLTGAVAVQAQTSSGGTGTAPAGAVTGSQTPQKTHLSYTLYSHWFSVLDITTDYLLDSARYDVSMDAHASGLLSLFMRMNIHSRAQGSVSDSVVRPQRYDSAGWARKTMRHVIIDYPLSGPRVVLQDPAETDREPVSEDQRRAATDILGTMMKVLAQIRQTGRCDGTFDIFDGIRLTRMTLSTAGMEPPPDIRKEWRAPAMRCNFTGRQIAGFIKGHESTSSLREQHGGSMWFETIPGFGPVAVRVEMEHPKIGKATALLTKDPTLVP
ncbi:DUF3108 domain-containing protein [Acetobacter oeni]|uniref:DUF3108 domain-containing protein n=1 Tax=Acetobacter oeni TaxID=304077 RepID=A0A511XHE6_9PROT|nr:DUF3108 domain-containing protein [Acetobacter oeni]MBB3881225.1 hypothetical protein [Acetobacter oeni]NHO18100.1 DUF3108 domain-containing protein [Acetobacter oeni]GBR08304.1 hypothetical protein AA21952_2578 [Acetobacter oeni LMG 21952]GEN62376.1 hypothetical protein AOE01nite_06000 [Acetobacter oeni]